jgi:predicted TIM-barrel fold metal-dependent hydrolase
LRHATKSEHRGAVCGVRLNPHPNADIRRALLWKRLSDYFSENFYVTMSGNFHTSALLNTMLEIGADRIMFSTDRSFENIDHAAVWFDVCPISENDRVKIGRENARRLFRLGN